MMSEAVISNIVSFEPIFLKERRMGYYKAQVKKAELLNKISSLFEDINFKPASYEEINILVENLQDILPKLIDSQRLFEVLEDDYPAVGNEAMFPDGVV